MSLYLFIAAMSCGSELKQKGPSKSALKTSSSDWCDSNLRSCSYLDEEDGLKSALLQIKCNKNKFVGENPK